MLPDGTRIYSLHDLAHVSWVGSVPHMQIPHNLFTTACEELDDLDHDLSDVPEVI